jgi:hypothetical protein
MVDVECLHHLVSSPLLASSLSIFNDCNSECGAGATSDVLQRTSCVSAKPCPAVLLLLRKSKKKRRSEGPICVTLDESLSLWHVVVLLSTITTTSKAKKVKSRREILIRYHRHYCRWWIVQTDGRCCYHHHHLIPYII